MPWKTALDNVKVALEPMGVSDAEADKRARDWLGRVGLRAFVERYPHMLSGGQRKRVALAQMLIRDPEILLMDEPFGPLDAQTRQIMGNLLLDLWSRDRKALIFVTHDLEEAIALSDRVVVMTAGPAAGIVADYKVPLARPRDIAEIRLEKAFHEIHRDIWASLRVEVQKAYAMGEGKELVYQVIYGAQGPMGLIFQGDFKPQESKSFKVKLTGEPIQRVPESKVYCRFVPERLDDFAWENDRIA